MNISNKTPLVVTVGITVASIVVTVLSPWPSTWIARKFSVSLLTAKFITVGSIIAIVIIFVIAVILLKRRHSSNSLPNGAVNSKAIYTYLYSTLLAFQNSLASRRRELASEQEITRKNQRYHQERIYKLMKLNLLDCEMPWFSHSSGDPKWRPYIDVRREIEKGIKKIHKTLHARLSQPEYVIRFAANQAQELLEDVRQALKELSEAEKNLVQTNSTRN